MSHKEVLSVKPKDSPVRNPPARSSSSHSLSPCSSWLKGLTFPVTYLYLLVLFLSYKSPSLSPKKPFTWMTVCFISLQLLSLFSHSPPWHHFVFLNPPLMVLISSFPHDCPIYNFSVIPARPIPFIFSSHVSWLHRHHQFLRIAAVTVFIVLESNLDLCLSRLPVPSHSLSSSFLFLPCECPRSSCFKAFSPVYCREFPSYRLLDHSLHSWHASWHCWGSSQCLQCKSGAEVSLHHSYLHNWPSNEEAQCDWWTKRGWGAKEKKKRETWKERGGRGDLVMCVNSVPKIDHCGLLSFLCPWLTEMLLI